MSSQSTQQHRAEAQELPPVRVAVFTISDTRTPETDKSGQLIRESLEADGHQVVHYDVLKDDPAAIKDRIHMLVSSRGADVILTNGGTGIAPRDGTFEAIDSLIERPLPGFGELFRMLSWDEVGAASMLSRATAGLRGRTLIFSMPGSSNAVNLAMTRLILPEIKHLVYEMKGIREKK
ncbi:MogA/MoaB family molybdenum cofactor biosynthesis protein [bacterium]|nr:MogA/MoaB family molybdenum cofactor biosynthesis protein [bacterium]